MTSPKASLLFIAAALCSFTAWGQWTDYGFWTSASVAQQIDNKNGYSIEFMSRWDRDITRLGSTFINADFSRQVIKNTEVRASLRLGLSRTDEYAWESLRRVSGALRWKDGFSDKWGASIKLKVQSGHKGVAMEGFAIDFSEAIRLKPTVYYKVSKGVRLSFSAEWFFRPLYSTYEWSDTRVRISLKKKVGKRRYLTLGYQIQHPRISTDPWTEHTLICSFDLKKKKIKKDN